MSHFKGQKYFTSILNLLKVVETILFLSDFIHSYFTFSFHHARVSWIKQTYFLENVPN